MNGVVTWTGLIGAGLVRLYRIKSGPGSGPETVHSQRQHATADLSRRRPPPRRRSGRASPRRCSGRHKSSVSAAAPPGRPTPPAGHTLQRSAPGFRTVGCASVHRDVRRGCHICSALRSAQQHDPGCRGWNTSFSTSCTSLTQERACMQTACCSSSFTREAQYTLDWKWRPPCLCP